MAEVIRNGRILTLTLSPDELNTYGGLEELGISSALVEYVTLWLEEQGNKIITARYRALPEAQRITVSDVLTAAPLSNQRNPNVTNTIPVTRIGA